MKEEKIYFFRCPRFWPLAPPLGTKQKGWKSQGDSTLNISTCSNTNDSIQEKKEKKTNLRCSRFWPLAPTPGMHPHVRSRRGVKANTAWCQVIEYKWFLISGWSGINIISLAPPTGMYPHVLRPSATKDLNCWGQDISSSYYKIIENTRLSLCFFKTMASKENMLKISWW